MKNKINMGKKIENFRQVCINRYNALYLENDYRKGNNLERRLVSQAQELIISQEGVRALLKMLQDENEIVRYYSASIIFSLYPNEAQNTLKNIEKTGKTHLASNVKYVIKNYEEGNNYFEKFLAENKN